MDNHSKTRPKQDGSDDWDDSVILSSFEIGIQSFRTKSQTTKTIPENRSSSAPTSSFAQCLSSYAGNNSSGTKQGLSAPVDSANTKAVKSGAPAAVKDFNNRDATTRKRKLDGADADSAHKAAASGAVQHVDASVVPVSMQDACSTQPQQEEQPQTAEHSQDNAYGSYPALPPSTGNVVEDEQLQGLLMAWYYSGYATGRYQALKEMGYYAAAGSDSTTAAATTTGITDTSDKIASEQQDSERNNTSC